MKRIIAIILAMICTVSLFAACGNTPDANSAAADTTNAQTTATVDDQAQTDDPITITFYTYNYSAAQKPGVDALVEGFKADNPGIDVEIILGQTDKIQADLAAGITPDVIQLIFDGLDYGIGNFGIQDINSIADPAELEEHLSGFEPAALDVARVDGKLMGLPYTFSTPILFYNATLFEEAGLDPEAPPTTWEEVKQYALQIKEKTGKGGILLGDTSTDWSIQALIKSNGGSVMSDDKTTIQFGEQAAIEAIEVWQDFTQSGVQPEIIDSMQAGEAFATGELGMMFFTAAMQASMIEASNAGSWELRTAKMPRYGDKPAVPVNSGSGLFICSTDPAKQQAAWKFIKHVTSDEGYTIITSQMGYPPLRPAIIDDERYLKEWAEANPLAGPNLEQLKIVTPWESYPGSNWSQIVTIFMDAIKTSVFTDADVAETMRAAQEQAQSLMPS